MKVSDIKTEDMARTGDLATILRKGRFDLSLSEILQAEKALSWLQDLGISMADVYKKETTAEIKVDQAKEEPKAGFVIKEWNPTGNKSVIKKTK